MNSFKICWTVEGVKDKYKGWQQIAKYGYNGERVKN